MPLTNSQYNAIMRAYDAKQAANRALLEKRQAEIEQTIPAYNNLRTQIIETSMQYARLSLQTDTSSVSFAELRAKNEELSRKKEALLLANGYPVDYLSPIYSCPDCKDTGMIKNERCHCFKQAAVDLLYAQSNIATIIQEENFDTFSLDYYNDTIVDPKLQLTSRQNMESIYHTCQSFIKNFDKEFNNLLFYGNSGLGKTFLSHCIAKELLKTAHTVLYLTSYELFDILGKAIQEEDKAQNASSEHILNCDLLIIDDLGTELATAFTISKLSICINERFLNRRSTIISTNFGVSELSLHYGERNCSRIFSNYRMIRFFGEDIRLKKKVKA